MEKIRLGVIGSGYWGPNLIRNFVELPGADLVAVADLKEDRLSHIHTRYPQIKTTKDYHDLFALELEGVAIATPPATHFKVVKEALEHGLNVLVEKPMTLTSQDAEELISLADKQGLILMVGHTFEYNGAVRKLKSMIVSGELGEIYYVDMVRVNLGLFQRDLNVMWDLAPHDLSILNYILDRDPVRVSAHGRPCVLDGIHDLAYIHLIYPDNILAHIHVSWLDPCKVRRITVVGSKKMVVYDDVEPLEKIKVYDKGVEPPPYTDTYPEFQLSYRNGDIVIPNLRMPEPLREECQHFIECIVQHTKPCSSGEDGLRVIKVLEAAQRSLMNGQHPEVVLW